MWAVLAGLAGARLYHVITDWQRFEGRRWDVFAVWEGGLGIRGGLAAGVFVGVWAARRRGLPVAQLLDVVAPAIPVAQAIGRLGNWFNQELLGRPTDLPWSLEIDPRPASRPLRRCHHVPPHVPRRGLWNRALAGVLVAAERRWHPRPGQLFAGTWLATPPARLWVEALRVDPATGLLGARVNLWVSGVVLVAGTTVLIVRSRRSQPALDAEPSRV